MSASQPDPPDSQPSKAKEPVSSDRGGPNTPLDDGIELADGVFLPTSALRFTFTRSSGPGGQNVNKRSTKARLCVSLDDLRGVMPAPAVARLVRLAGPARMNSEEELSLSEESSRSQVTNRRICVEKLSAMVTSAMKPPRIRRKTKPTRASKRRRIETKKQRAQVKQMRRRPNDDSASRG